MVFVVPKENEAMMHFGIEAWSINYSGTTNRLHTSASDGLQTTVQKFEIAFRRSDNENGRFHNILLIS